MQKVWLARRATRSRLVASSSPKLNLRACSTCCLLMPQATTLQPWQHCCKPTKLVVRLQSSGGSVQDSWLVQAWI